MTGRGRIAAIGVATIATVAVFAGACGGGSNDNNNDNGGGGGGPAGQDKVIAPYGFKLEIQSAEIPADASNAATPPTVTFRVSGENDAPIDDLQQRLKNFAATPKVFPYVRAPSFTLARLEPDSTYRSYYLNAAGDQAVSVALPSDDAAWTARVTSLGNGTYRFKLNPLPANPTAEERGRTHTVGVYGSNFQKEGAAEQPATSTLNFVPAGGNPDTLQVVSAQACNTCHAPAVLAHGRRLGVQVCLTCHTSQTKDPDTGNSVEFTEMIHKIHYGGDRPGDKYEIVGFGGNRFTFDEPWMNDVRNCALCHQGEDADRHVTAPSQQACLTCHSIVKFDATAAASCDPEKRDTVACNHFPIAQGTACNTCHTPDQIRSQHVPMAEVAKQFKYEIQSVTVGQDRKPTVRFRVLDASNQPRDLETDAAYKAPTSSLNVQLGWPSKEHTNVGASLTAPGQPRSIAIVRGGAFDPADTVTVNKVAGQTGVYEVTSPIALPDGVNDGTVLMDGHPSVHGENVPVVNATADFAVAGAAPARRTVVAVENCNKCHGVVSAHGQNRNGNIAACVVCHNPKATDAQKRLGVADAADAAAEQSVDFKVLIHGVHAADIRHDPLVVYGFNGANAATGGAPGTKHEFPGEVPHDVGNCNLCHVNDSWKLPMAAEVLDPVVKTNEITNQADDVTAGRVRMVCTACHDQVRFAQESPALPMCNTVAPINSAACFHSGAAQADDSSCAACHGAGAPYDIATRHPIK